jgi:hypothetical protein
VRRLTWLLLGWGLATYGFGIIAGGDGFVAYRLRDGLVVALFGAILFAWHTLPFAPSALLGGERNWPLWGRIFLGTGFACGAAATVLLTLWGTQSWTNWLGGSLWAVGALALMVGLFWPGRVEIYPAPAFRWRVDAAGNYVRYALDDPDSSVDSSANSLADSLPFISPSLSSRPHLLYSLILILLLFVGVTARLWRLTTMPATCVDMECALALRLVEGSWPQGFNAESLSLYALLTRTLFAYTNESLTALRGASAILGALTLSAIYWAARAYVKPAGALVALLVVALLPWTLWISRFGTTWSVAPLLLALVLGTSGRALVRPSHRWWGLTGVLLGLLLMQPLPLWSVTLGWLVVMGIAAWWAQGRTQRESLWRVLIDHVGVLIACALALGLPLALPAWRAAMLPATGDATSVSYEPLALVAGLLHSGGAIVNYFLTNALLPPWASALALVGLATLLRWGRQPRAAVVAVGALLYAAGNLLFLPTLLTSSSFSTTLTLPVVGAAEAWLPLLPFLALGIGVASDQLFTVFYRAWAILLPMRRTVAVVIVLLALLVGREGLMLTGQLARTTGSSQSDTELAIGQYLARCLRAEAMDDPCSQQGENAPIFFVPPATVNHPATRLLIGNALQNGQVRAFDPGRDLLPSTTPTGDLFYLVPLDNQPIIELLRELYPEAVLRTEPADPSSPTLFAVIQIAWADVIAHQGLSGHYFASAEPAGEPVATTMDGALRFEWSNNPPLDAPFSVIWEGSLLVPVAGTYIFDLEGAAGPDAPVINLQLDGNLVLDSSLGLTEKPETLAQGAYQMVLRYRTNGTPTDWALRWTPPGGVPEAIPQPHLYAPMLPNIGLIGTYYAGTTWEGPTLTTRKDMVLGTPVDLPMPYSVQWTGKLAAPRAGEYFFAVTANGPVTLLLDGRETLLHSPSAELAIGPGYTQSSIYLERGWHNIDLRYAPANGSDLRILWQPPGSGPFLLGGRNLVPTQAPITSTDLPLPPAPELSDARLGNDHFALSLNLEMYQNRPLRSLPPANLPLLLAEQVWTSANGCGVEGGQLASPRGIALDASAERVYVADAENRRVVELQLTDGAQVATYAIPEFQEPVDVAIAPDGTLLVLDASAQGIFRIDRATGEAAALTLDTSFYHPRGFSVDEVGNMAVADTGGARVVLLDPTGTLLAQFGGQQTSLGTGQPVDTLALGAQWWAMAADHGRLWLLDAMGSVAISERTNTATGPQMAALPNGSGFFLSDPFRRTVLYLAPSGEPIGQLGYAEEFVNPMGVAASTGANGLVNLVVGDSAACSVSLWRLRAE